LNQLGNCYYFDKNPNFNEAFIWYFKAYEIDPNNAWLINQIGGGCDFNLM
jgi:TPR repeat protein